MSETVTKVVQGVDSLFDEIVVNGRTVKSTPSGRATHTTQTSPAPRAEPVEGEYVGAVQLNNTIHGLKDVPLTQRVANLENGVRDINELIPSSASSANKLTDKSYVDNSISDSITEAIEDLDVSEVGGNGKYIKSIKQVNGKIEAEEDWLSSTGAGVAFIGTRAQYEQAKLIPLGQTGHIPSGSLVLITDEDAYVEGEDR
jgi:hypothetical protein